MKIIFIRIFALVSSSFYLYSEESHINNIDELICLVNQNDTVAMSEAGFDSQHYFESSLPDGFTVLSYAIINYEPLSIMFMLNHGASLDINNPNGADLYQVLIKATQNAFDKLEETTDEFQREIIYVKFISTVQLLLSKFGSDPTTQHEIIKTVIATIEDYDNNHSASSPE